ncbi:MAG: hypothetical protein RJB62_1256 [Pseudomonadota bacterium]
MRADLVKVVANNLKTADASVEGLTRFLAEPLLWPALAIYVLAMVLWIAVLRDAHISLANTVLIATSIIIVSFEGAFVFHEDMSIMRMAGIGIILTGLVATAVFG